MLIMLKISQNRPITKDPAWSQVLKNENMQHNNYKILKRIENLLIQAHDMSKGLSPDAADITEFLQTKINIIINDVMEVNSFPSIPFHKSPV